MKTTQRVKAILLAGDRRASIQVRNDNKAFLELNGRPLFIHVLQALLNSDLVEKVIIVGPSDRLLAALQGHGLQDNVVVIEQRDNMINNFKAGYVAALGLGPEVDFWSLKGTEHEDTPVLIAPCDVPLLIPAEVDEFLMRSNMHEYDYSIGITSEQVLSYYHSRRGVPGIQMIYVHVKEGLMRHNNLHIAKPLRFEHLDYIEKMYEWRYQTRAANVIRMFFSLLVNGWRLFKGLRMFILMQLSLYYDRHGHPKLSDRLRSLVGFNRLSEGFSNALGARVQITYTHFGGAALDVDNEKDLTVIEERFEEWIEYQNSLNF
jgi:GTP:adenosylcobinamide-phosphate guanylyltransferase